MRSEDNRFTNSVWTLESICPKCHKPYVFIGDPWTGEIGKEPFCTCLRDAQLPKGWVCPICGQVNSPSITSCSGDHERKE